MVNKKKLLEKIALWKNDARFSTGVYRAYAYFAWDDIPKEIQEAFPPEAKENWDNIVITTDDLTYDIESTIRTVLTQMAKLKIVQSLGMIPVIFADLTALGKATATYEGNLVKIFENYEKYYYIDRGLAEIETVQSVGNLFTTIANKLKLSLDFDIDDIVNRILNGVPTNAYNITKTETKTEMPENLDEIIDKALQDYESRTGESILEDTSEPLIFGDDDV